MGGCVGSGGFFGVRLRPRGFLSAIHCHVPFREPDRDVASLLAVEGPLVPVKFDGSAGILEKDSIGRIPTKSRTVILQPSKPKSIS